MPSQEQLREQICRIGRRMDRREMVAANDGNISCRLTDGRFLVTPTGVSKGQMTPGMLLIVDGRGDLLDGPGRTTSEIGMHLEIYRRRPDVQAVAHAHPPHVMAFLVAGRQIPAGILPEVEVLLGPVPVADYATPGSEQVASNVAACLDETTNTICLDHHGAVGFDADLQRAYDHLETLESYCRILLLSARLGPPIPLGEHRMAELLTAKARMGLADPRLPESKGKSND